MDWRTYITQQIDDIKYLSLGLRATRPDEHYRIGDRARNSYDWDYEADCSSDDELDGTCAVEIDWVDTADELIAEIERTLQTVEQYHGVHVVLLGGDNSSYGTDPGEIVISNARVLAIIR